MTKPKIIQDITFRSYLRASGPVFGAILGKHFVAVLMGLIHCRVSRKLSDFLRQVQAG
jgi:hypothetical protein